MGTLVTFREAPIQVSNDDCDAINKLLSGNCVKNIMR